MVEPRVRGGVFGVAGSECKAAGGGAARRRGKLVGTRRRRGAMTDQSLCLIVVVLDRSGSMASIKNEMEGGLNAFVAEQAKLPGKCLFTLASFDEWNGKTEVEWPYEEEPIGAVGQIVIIPRGGT